MDLKAISNQRRRVMNELLTNFKAGDEILVDGFDKARHNGVFIVISVSDDPSIGMAVRRKEADEKEPMMQPD